MTQKQKNQLKRDIKNLLERSYEDDGNSYEIEFRCMLEDIYDVWEELTKSSERDIIRLLNSYK